MKVEFDIDPTEIIKKIIKVNGIMSILNDLNLDEADILNYIPIEELVRFAYKDDPDQVRENLLDIIEPDIPVAVVYNPEKAEDIRAFAGKACGSSKEAGVSLFLELLKSELKGLATILYEVEE